MSAKVMRLCLTTRRHATRDETRTDDRGAVSTVANTADDPRSRNIPPGWMAVVVCEAA
jgi:hypothetical protein